MEELRVKANNLSLRDAFRCGQCFRWKEDGGGTWEGVVRGRVIRIRQDGEFLNIRGVSGEEYDGWLRGYLGLDVDYDRILRILSQDSVLREAIAYSPGIRVLRQDFWETLCTFILSQNNNIPRITSLVERLCAAFGRPLEGGWHAFPDSGVLAALREEDLSPLRAGYRSAYILDAARRVASGEISGPALAGMTLGEARKTLLGIHGVGPKVAECVLLFGAGRLDAFPLDVWMKRVMRRHYPGGLPDYALPYAGIAQQYLFHFARTSEKSENAGRASLPIC